MRLPFNKVGMEENPQWDDVIYKMLQPAQCVMAENDLLW